MPTAAPVLNLRHVFIGLREIGEIKRDLKAGKIKEIELSSVQVTTEGWNEIATGVVDSHCLQIIKLEDVVIPVKTLSTLTRWSKAAVGRSLIANNSNYSEVKSAPTAITDPSTCVVALELEIKHLKTLDIDYSPSPPHISWASVSSQLTNCRDLAISEITTIPNPTSYLGPVGMTLYNYSAALIDTTLKQVYVEAWLNAVGRAYDSVINKSRLHSSTMVSKIVGNIIGVILSKEYIEELEKISENKFEVLKRLFNTYAKCCGIANGEFTNDSLLVFVSSLKVDSMIPRESGTPLDRLAIAQAKCIRAVEVNYHRKHSKHLSPPENTPSKVPPASPPKVMFSVPGNLNKLSTTDEISTFSLSPDAVPVSSPRDGFSPPAIKQTIPVKVPIGPGSPSRAPRPPSDQYGLVNVDENDTVDDAVCYFIVYGGGSFKKKKKYNKKKNIRNHRHQRDLGKCSQ